jgi:predicted amidohydrolase
MFEEKIRGISESTEVIILPEMFSTGFSMRAEALAETIEGPTVQWMKMMAKQIKAIITGSLIISEDGKYYNRLIWMQPDGKMGQYNKRHLFGYAGEADHYSSGSNRLTVSVNGWKILLIICYDLRFPVWLRQQMNGDEPEYDCIICVANWPDRRNHAWKTLIQARAIENLCFVIGVNRVGHDGNQYYHTGDTMIADPLGTVLYTREKEEHIYTRTLKKEELYAVRSKLTFLQDADEFNIIT